MLETNEKVEQLNMFINRRNDLLNLLRDKEDIYNLTQNEDDNLANNFEDLLNECKMCDLKIKEYKKELLPRYYLSFDEENSEYNQSQETALVVKKENKIINWFKNKISEFRYNYSIERALKRDNFIEQNITNQISSYNAYLNVIKVNGNKAIFKKHINKIGELKKNSEII